jgi:hypothetical protein
MHFISLNFDYKGLVQDTLIGESLDSTAAIFEKVTIL